MHVSQDMPEHVSRCLVNFSLDEKTSLHRSQYTFSVIITHYTMPSYNMVTAHHLDWLKTAFGTIPSRQNLDQAGIINSLLPEHIGNYIDKYTAPEFASQCLDIDSLIRHHVLYTKYRCAVMYILQSGRAVWDTMCTTGPYQSTCVLLGKVSDSKALCSNR